MPYLRSTAAYLPERIVTNGELASLVGESAEWIENASGIEQRRYAAADQNWLLHPWSLWVARQF